MSDPSPLREIPEAELLRRLDRAARSAAGALRRLFLSAAEALRSGVRVDELLDGLRRQNLDAVLRSVDWQKFEQALWTGFRGEQEGYRDSPVGGAYHAGAELGEAMLPESNSDAVLNLERLNDGAVRWLEREGLQLVTDVSAETRNALRAIIERGYIEGRSVEAMTRDVRRVIGLTSRQARTLDAYAAALDEQTGLSGARRAQLVDRRFRALLRRRADLIARTESQQAGNVGQVNMWREARMDGRLDADAYVREWVTRRVSVCPLCEALDGETAEIDGRFPDGSDGPLKHPGCFCAARLIRRAEALRRAA